jgi:DNA polymerase elongation subunit (family B)
VDWFSVISRGSQFKVESFMFRIAKPESFLLLSPSKDDVRPSNLAHEKSEILALTFFWTRSEDRTLRSVCR